MAAPNWIGQKIGGRYEIKELLGEGGMSAVYRAYDPNLRRDVALKLIHSHLSRQAEFVRRFEEEAAAVAQLRHENIVQVFDFSHDDDLYYIVFEFIDGESLQQRIKRLHDAGEKMTFAEISNVASEIGEALDYAHGQGIVHRDIKPANIMINQRNQPILTDFGIVKIVGGDQNTATGSLLGTARYMSPEQVKGSGVDHRTDIYALGVMLYEMVGGRAPFEADSMMTLMMMHLQQPPPPITQFRGDVPATLEPMLKKALAKEPDDRFQSGGELARAFKQAVVQTNLATMYPPVTDQPPMGEPTLNYPVADAGTIQAPPPVVDSPLPSLPPAPVVPPAASNRNKWIMGCLGLFILGVCGSCAYLFSQTDTFVTPTAQVAQASPATKTPSPIEVTSAVATGFPPTLPAQDATPTSPPVIRNILLEERFDDIGNWGSDKDEEVNATVRNGRFIFQVNEPKKLFWSSAGEEFGDAIYELDATYTGGPENNGFGMVFRLNHDTNSFYLFEISGDGFVWIGYCADGCAEVEMLVGDGWFQSDAVNQGLDQLNHLRVSAKGTNMTFFVNDTQVGEVKDNRLKRGDIAILVETLEEGDVQVSFDNFVVREAD